jgi:hypothetical protein
MSGKGSKQRPINLEAFGSNYDAIFRKNKTEDNTGTNKNEYYDIMTTEQALDRLAEINRDLGLSYEDLGNPLIKE